MDYTTLLLGAIVAASCTAAGVAVGKAWGSYGKQTTILCNVAREACRETMSAKFDAIIERLKRIEQHVLDNKRPHP